ncbi:MAG: hypothetical protein WDN28_26105 [Chthoniobacter sp.]
MDTKQYGAHAPTNETLRQWVEQVRTIVTPDQVFWVDGSEEEKQFLTEQAVAEGILLKLNQEKLPGCYYHRSNPNDVARVEQCTFICTPAKDEAGPTNNWAAPREMYEKLYGLLRGAMVGRTMYVVPYLMGPPGSPLTKVGIEITDSIYVVLNMRIMSRMGKIALDQLGTSDDFNRGIHSTLDCHPDRRFIAHFPQDNTIISVGSGYGGNVLLREEVPRIAHRQLPRPHPGLDGRAHADPVRGITGRRKDLCGSGVPQRLRQDEFRDVDSAESVQRLENHHHRR